MMSGRWRPVVGAAVLAACVVVSPTAHAAASCNWVTTDLPVPAGKTFYNLIAGSDDGEWVLADVYDASLGNGVLVWRDGVPQEQFFPESTRVVEVNNSGVLLANGDGAHRIKDGVRERLEPATGKTEASGDSINNAGDVAGLSGSYGMYGPIVVWPAGETTPRELPGTRNGLVRFVKGIDDHGNVIAKETGPESQAISRVWDRNGVMTRLETLPGDYSAYAEVIRNGRIFGRSEPRDWSAQPSTVVEWGLDGKIVRTFQEFSHMHDANAAGAVLVQTAEGYRAVSRAPGELDTPPDLDAVLLADNGDVHGIKYEGNNRSRPRYSSCG